MSRRARAEISAAGQQREEIRVGTLDEGGATGLGNGVPSSVDGARWLVDARRPTWPAKNRMSTGLLTLVILNCLLLGPSWILHEGIRPHWLALEAGLILGVALLLPRARWSAVVAGIAALSILAVAMLSLGDTLVRMSLARPLNLYLDQQLLSAASRLIDGNLGRGWGTVVLLGAAALAATTTGGLTLLLLRLRRTGEGRRSWLPGVAAIAVCAAAIPARWAHPSGVVLALPATQLVRDQTIHLGQMLGEQKRFAAEMAAASTSIPSGPSLLGALAGRDVILAFIESYGISAVQDPRYRSIVRPRLEAMERLLGEADIHVATGLLLAPSQGGMSWLGHGTLLSGLWLQNQLRYDLFLASDQQTLIDDFAAAGYRTAALMPAITMAWPEGDRLGYDEIWTFEEIDYAGPPLNWVTMPDQFTWSFLEHTIRRERDDGRPLFAELSLISSHAPWTPVLDVLDDWEVIGDGAVFAAWEGAGQSPEALWRNADRVREHFALSVGYSLDVLTSYTRRYLDPDTVIIALGDHQPAPLVTGPRASRAVPVHVITASPGLLKPFLDWGFVSGTLPPEVPSDMEVQRMDAFRNWFVSAFSHARAQTPEDTYALKPCPSEHCPKPSP